MSIGIKKKAEFCSYSGFSKELLVILAFSKSFSCTEHTHLPPSSAHDVMLVLLTSPVERVDPVLHSGP